MINCVFENGGKANLRHVVMGAIVVNQTKDKVLLVKRATNVEVRPNKYTIPGGFLDMKEDTRQGILRELREETGYEGKIISLFRVKDNPDRINEDRQNIDFVYIIEAGEKVGEHDHEISEVKWFDLDSLPLAEEWAFDHLADLELFKEYLKSPFFLPTLGRDKSNQFA